MLLVNGFKPIQTNYNNQNSNKTNFSQPQFCTKADSVSFSSAMDKTAKAQMAALVQKVGSEYSDVCGFKNFKKFYEQAFDFLGNKNVRVYNQSLENFEIKTARPFLREGRIKAFQAMLKDETNMPIHGLGDSVVEVTPTAANARLFDKLVNDKMAVSFENNFFIECPAELRHQASRTVEALNRVKAGWYEIPYSSDDEKLVLLRDAYNELLLGGRPKS